MLQSIQPQKLEQHRNMMRTFLIAAVALTLLQSASGQCCTKFYSQTCMSCPQGMHLYKHNCIFNTPYCINYTDGFTCNRCFQDYSLTQSNTCQRNYNSNFKLYNLPPQDHNFTSAPEEINNNRTNYFVRQILMERNMSWDGVKADWVLKKTDKGGSELRVIVGVTDGFVQNTYKEINSSVYDLIQSQVFWSGAGIDSVLVSEKDQTVQLALVYIKNFMFEFNQFDFVEAYRVIPATEGGDQWYRIFFYSDKWDGLKQVNISGSLVHQKIQTLNLSKITPDLTNLILIAITSSNLTQYLLPESSTLTSITISTLNTSKYLYNVSYSHPDEVPLYQYIQPRSYITFEQDIGDLNQVTVVSYFMFMEQVLDPEVDVVFFGDQVGGGGDGLEGDFVEAGDSGDGMGVGMGEGELMEFGIVSRMIQKVLKRSYRQKIKNAELTRVARSENQDSKFYYYQFKQIVDEIITHRFTFTYSKQNQSLQVSQYSSNPSSKTTTLSFTPQNNTIPTILNLLPQPLPTLYTNLNQTQSQYHNPKKSKLLFIESRQENHTRPVSVDGSFYQLVNWTCFGFYNFGEELKEQFVEFCYQVEDKGKGKGVGYRIMRRFFKSRAEYQVVGFDQGVVRMVVDAVQKAANTFIPDKQLQTITRSKTNPKIYRLLTKSTKTTTTPTKTTTTTTTLHQIHIPNPSLPSISTILHLLTNTTYIPTITQDQITSSLHIRNDPMYDRILSMIQREFWDEVLGRYLLYVVKVQVQGGNFGYEVLYVDFEDFSTVRIVFSLGIQHVSLNILSMQQLYIEPSYLLPKKTSLYIPPPSQLATLNHPTLTTLYQHLTNTSITSPSLSITSTQTELIIQQPSGRRYSFGYRVPVRKIQMVEIYPEFGMEEIAAVDLRRGIQGAIGVEVGVVQMQVVGRRTLMGYVDTYTVDFVLDRGQDQKYIQQYSINIQQNPTPKIPNMPTYQPRYTPTTRFNTTPIEVPSPLPNAQRLVFQMLGRNVSNAYRNYSREEIVQKVLGRIYGVGGLGDVEVLRNGTGNGRFYLWDHPIHVVFDQNTTINDYSYQITPLTYITNSTYNSPLSQPTTTTTTTQSPPQPIPSTDQTAKLLTLTTTRKITPLSKRKLTSPDNKTYEIYCCVYDVDGRVEFVVEGGRVREVVFGDDGFRVSGNDVNQLESKNPRIYAISKILSKQITQLLTTFNSHIPSPFQSPTLPMSLTQYSQKSNNKVQTLQLIYQLPSYSIRIKVLTHQHNLFWSEMHLLDLEILETGMDVLREQGKREREMEMQGILGTGMGILGTGMGMGRGMVKEVEMVLREFVGVGGELVGVFVAERNQGMVVFDVKYDTPYGILSGQIAYQHNTNPPKILQMANPSPTPNPNPQSNCLMLSSTGKGCVECSPKYYLHHDANCYPKIPNCSHQNGKVCLSCDVGFRLRGYLECF